MDRDRPRHRRNTHAAKKSEQHSATRANESAVRLPADYVADHVELGYATTAHRAQGMTVDATFAVLRPGMSRELAYVALTRGRQENHAYVATDIADLGYDGAPAPDKPADKSSQQILATTDAQTSATETLRALHDEATSLAQMASIHETLVHDAQRQRWATVIAGSGLTAEQSHRVLTSPAYGPLVAALQPSRARRAPDARRAPRAHRRRTTRRPRRHDRERSCSSARHRLRPAPPGNRLARRNRAARQAIASNPLIAWTRSPQQATSAPTFRSTSALAIDHVETLMASHDDPATRKILDNPPAWLGTGPALSGANDPRNYRFRDAVEPIDVTARQREAANRPPSAGGPRDARTKPHRAQRRSHAKLAYDQRRRHIQEAQLSTERRSL